MQLSLNKHINYKKQKRYLNRYKSIIIILVFLLRGCRSCVLWSRELLSAWESSMWCVPGHLHLRKYLANGLEHLKGQIQPQIQNFKIWEKSESGFGSLFYSLCLQKCRAENQSTFPTGRENRRIRAGIDSSDSRSSHIQAVYSPKQCKCCHSKTCQNLTGFCFHFRLNM